MDVQNLRLGKAPTEIDPRTIKLKAILSVKLPPIPTTWNFDLGKAIPTPMFANNQYGNCVIAGRAHQTLRFEFNEQGKVIEISDRDVIDEYVKESGGPDIDNGLIMLDSLRQWRTGWLVGGNLYNIHAFAKVDHKDQQEVMAAAYCLSGLYCGVQLPLTAQEQLKNDQVWESVGGFCNKKAWKGTWGGHCMYLVGYNRIGPIFITWGKLQQVTWKWMHRYCDEAYGVVDDTDKFLVNSPINVEALEDLLKACCAV